jgi:hypothetical protein
VRDVESGDPFMNQMQSKITQTQRSVHGAAAAVLAGFALIAVPGPRAHAAENVPHRPFAMWADVPERGQFTVGLVYEESEAYHIWAGGNESHLVKWESGGESYGIDYNQGYVAMQYGITEKWAVDLNVGATTAGWRYFSNGHVESTTGLMDTSFGVRYQVFNEMEAGSPWIPTLTLRAGGILPGTYDEDFPFAPGVRSAAIEPEVLARKHFGWTGLGAYADGLFRWNRTTGNDQYIISVGLFQQIKGWELDAGYRHLQTISGGDIILNPDHSIDYPRDVREINDAIEAGFSYTTSKHHIRYGFQTRVTVDGSNTARNFWLGGSVDVPIGGKNGF